MKSAKKVLALLLIAVLLLSLPACKEEAKNTHSDWVFIPSSPNMGALSETGYYDSLNGVLTYSDIVTGTSVVLCQKAGCKHEYGVEGKDRCDAEMGISSMLFGNDTLYYVDRNTLYSRNAIGGELVELGMLAKELTQDRKSVDVFVLAVSNGYLYYEGDIKEIKQGASGGTSFTSAGACIGRFNLTQRKDEILVVLECEKYDEWMDPIAVRETGILYLYQEGLDPEQDWENVNTKERLEATRKMPVHIKHLDLTTGETTVLFTSTYLECKTIHALENGKIFYGRTYDSEYGTCSYDLSIGKVESVYKGEFSSSYYGKGYWLHSKWLDAQTAERHIYDMNTGKTLPCVLSGNFRIVNRSAHGMVMYYNNRSTHDGNYFLSYESLADGLQETDLKLLYANS